MNAARIIRSQIVPGVETGAVQVDWSDGIEVLFNVNDLQEVLAVASDEPQPLEIPNSEIERRIVVSRSSAQCTVKGCGA